MRQTGTTKVNGLEKNKTKHITIGLMYPNRETSQLVWKQLLTCIFDFKLHTLGVFS